MNFTGDGMQYPQPSEIPGQWRQARLARDPRFDGQFFVGVLTTGIFCRPICPARLPREDNIRYLLTPAQALEQGFRPCRRCRPEYSPPRHQQWPDERLQQAMDAIEQGFLDQSDCQHLAEKVGLGERQLRRLFQQSLGVSPNQVAQTRRLLLARQLLCESNLGITQVALAAGYNSIRRFNHQFREFYHQTPSEVRRQQRAASSDSTEIVIDLPHAADYPWRQVFGFYRQRAIEPFESAAENSFVRSLMFDSTPMQIRCEKLPRKQRIRLSIVGASATQLPALIAHCRRVLDLNSNHRVIAEHLRSDPLLNKIIAEEARIALPGAWDGFEYLVRAIIGQQVSVKAARTLTRRLLQRCGSSHQLAGEEVYFFPDAEALANADLGGLGLTGRRIDTLKRVAQAQLEETLQLQAGSLANREDLQTLRKSLLAINGIGPWTVDYLMMRAAFQPDIWLHTDLGVVNALKQLGEDLDKKSLARRADDWAPWRSYGVLALWSCLT
ncbi:DNA-3-methyladenine glycosylase 2 family protein [Pseudomaricurvus alkylphenolicus]|jgi:AraC family transcriptional regulator of adaptative response / DNA-3-methyladenine glycosylase II|uniref:DNA-3-methyladenine glycosylase 2 family protein n=1 Tax=Pseudomaricurvus alkylphenolicus TaxID=1306991 RepID=UPI0014233765|nr:Ada metal-binding domain-containing protein [Pseudomaricurvus alkylphenolicus]NIB40173.1 DNA-3-methyladenine glycosylase 2 family protein [Pseudomaricurvus alkylphenolicus]